MLRATFALCSGLILSLIWPGAVPAADSPRDLGSEVLAVFSAKCTPCHGPNLAKPKGRFGYVLDLARVAGNREMVVPSSPEESELWVLVRSNEMPAADSPAGPLSQEQKEVIRDWIAAGAPMVRSPGASTGSPQEPDQQTRVAGAPAPSLVEHALGALGKFHILVVHFPIALLLAAAFGELLVIWRPNHGLKSAVRFCVLLAATSSATAVALGWLHADIGGHGLSSASNLRLHRWLGTITCLWTLTVAVVLETDIRRQRRSILFRVMLAIGALLVSATGHFGGMLVHGESFFDW